VTAGKAELTATSAIRDMSDRPAGSDPRTTGSQA